MSKILSMMVTLSYFVLKVMNEVADEKLRKILEGLISDSTAVIPFYYYFGFYDFEQKGHKVEVKIKDVQIQREVLANYVSNLPSQPLSYTETFVQIDFKVYPYLDTDYRLISQFNIMTKYANIIEKGIKYHPSDNSKSYLPMLIGYSSYNKYVDSKRENFRYYQEHVDCGIFRSFKMEKEPNSLINTLTLYMKLSDFLKNLHSLGISFGEFKSYKFGEKQNQLKVISFYDSRDNFATKTDYSFQDCSGQTYAFISEKHHKTLNKDSTCDNEVLQELREETKKFIRFFMDECFSREIRFQKGFHWEKLWDFYGQKKKLTTEQLFEIVKNEFVDHLIKPYQESNYHIDCKSHFAGILRFLIITGYSDKNPAAFEMKHVHDLFSCLVKVITICNKERTDYSQELIKEIGEVVNGYTLLPNFIKIEKNNAQEIEDESAKCLQEQAKNVKKKQI